MPKFVVAAAIVGSSTPCFAQEAESKDGVQRIVITGSNIRRIEGETGLPVQVITRAEVERGAIMNAKDLLDRISAAQSYGNWTEGRGVGSNLGGFTAASLRGRGSERTLVLLNGRRISPYALSGSRCVDLSGIPASAIDRVEVLKDGASAVYGSDAIGGVINFILHKDYRGGELGATVLASQHGGGIERRATLTAGWGDLTADGFNAFLTLDRLDQAALRAVDRAFSRTAYLPDLGIDFTSSNSAPANITQPGGFGSGSAFTFNPGIPLSGATAASCQPPHSFAIQQFALRCGFDYVPLIADISQSQKTSAIGRLTWQLNRDHQFYVEGSYYRGEFTYKISPTPVASNFTFTEMYLPPGSPYYPTAFVAALPGGDTTLPIDLRYRTVELGARITRPVIDEWRALVGMQGTVRDWDYQLSLGSTSNKEIINYAGGFISEAKFGPLLRSGAINLFGAQHGRRVAADA